jgi:(heptosyl)LPS beta-1,4-glucosyltransferase
MAAISVVILAKNEEPVIERCIRSVAWADEIVVVDSGSTDRTRELATALGAQVYDQPWLGYAAQRNRGIELAQHDWIFMLDCDEVVTATLGWSIRSVLQSQPDPKDGFAVNRRGDFYGELLPNYLPRHRQLNFVRLFHRQYSGYDPTMKVHEEIRYPGKAHSLPGVLIHWRAYMMDEYITSINRYAGIEADVLNQKGVKANGVKIILRPLLRFIWCYIIKCEFRLGTRGLTHALLAAVGEYIRYTKLWELQSAPRVLHPPVALYAQLDASLDAQLDAPLDPPELPNYEYQPISRGKS